MKDILELKPEVLDKVNLWFIGIYYRQSENHTIIEDVYIKDFFKLDVKKIPVINFDAAIQIQWHVKDMVEIEDQDKLTFIEKLADTFMEQWQGHVKGKQEKYENTRNYFHQVSYNIIY
jgi:putative N-acetylmannosamine-6-phosphate epimerase